ncbi:uncharacterized protein KZ484_012394 isoform 2-T2 [Pholidichthys leucotaenia]
MDGSGWMKMFSFLMLVLQFTARVSPPPVQTNVATAGGGLSQNVITRAGLDITLPCGNVIPGQQNCSYTTWLFSNSSQKSSEELVAHGTVKKPQKPNKLSVMSTCDLVINNVTVEDVGQYFCRQYVSEKQHGKDHQVELSVIHMTEVKNTDKVNITCSVATYTGCKYTLKWIRNGITWNIGTRKAHASQSDCSASAYFIYTKIVPEEKYEHLHCSVTDKVTKKELWCSFNPSSPCKEPGGKAKTSTTSAAKSATLPTTTIQSIAQRDSEGLLWLYSLVAVALITLLLIIVKVIRSKRDKGNKRQENGIVQILTSAAAPQTSQETADTDVSYASINYSKINQAEAQRKSDDHSGDSVTYSTVKASSTDSNCLYSTVK